MKSVLIVPFSDVGFPDRKKLEVREDGKKKVVVVGLKEYVADNVMFVEQIIEHSAAARSTGAL